MMARWVVTGGSSGIGLATVDLAVVSGHHVVSIDKVQCPRPGVVSVIADLADPIAIADAASTITGPVDVLVNNAGVPGTHSAETVLRVNALAVRLLTDLLRDRMPAGSCVINVASIAGRRWAQRVDLVRSLLDTSSYDDGVAWIAEHPMSGKDAYTFSKECVIVLTQRWGALLRTHGIRACSVSPGPVETAIIGDFRTSMGDARIDWTAEQTGRLAHPGDIAPVIAALAGSGMQWVNAVDIPVDGGLTGGLPGGWVSSGE
jgi:NAD(P)-dependent dehydrogenase (short-subunit alcohol dehydrogenase family)